jgi:dTDP-4-amino-4,6-dideoxygalactose transaminase
MSRFTIPLFDLNFGEEEAASVAEAVRSGWISMGPRAALLEERFADHLGVEHAVAVGSGTAALHIALAMLVKPGDEVIVPSLTFVATVNAVRYAHATPVFADITSADDLSLDPDDVRRKLGERTKVILPMHYGGFPCNMDSLTEIASRHGLHVVEDAAHAPDSEYQGRRLGTIGDMGCFSFFANKNMTCAEGGMLVTDHTVLARRARLMRSHGMTTVSYDRARGHAASYDVVELGFNYRLDDIRASLALAQLPRLKPDTEARRSLRRRYEENLRGVDSVTVPYRGCDHPSSNYIFPVVLKSGGSVARDAVRERLADRGIQTSVHYPAVHRFSIYEDPDLRLPVTDHVADHEITLPLFSTMSISQVDQVTEALIAALHAEGVA